MAAAVVSQDDWVMVPGQRIVEVYPKSALSSEQLSRLFEILGILGAVVALACACAVVYKAGREGIPFILAGIIGIIFVAIAIPPKIEEVKITANGTVGDGQRISGELQKFSGRSVELLTINNLGSSKFTISENMMLALTAIRCTKLVLIKCVLPSTFTAPCAYATHYFKKTEQGDKIIFTRYALSK